MSEKRERKPNLTEAHKAQILLMKGQGHKNRDIAKHFDISERQVTRHLSLLRKAAAFTDAAHTKPTAPLPNPKQIVQRLAYDAVQAGLEHKEDPYKRGNLGVRVLQGTGEFQPENGGVNILNLINTMPPEYRERYIIEAEPETAT